MRRLAFSLIACLSLTGCSDEPSESEMREAVEAHTKAVQQRAGRPFQTFAAFRKQGCVDDKKSPGYWDCYYAATIPGGPSSDKMDVNGKGRFRRDSKGLSFEDLGAQPR